MHPVNRSKALRLPATSLEQWALLAGVVDRGGFAQAGRAAHRSQSAVSYNLARLQESLGVALLKIEGRRAVLTPHGAALLSRARGLVDELLALEQTAASLKRGWESEITLVVDAAFPQPRLFQVLAELQRDCRRTQLRLAEAVLSGAEQAIVEARADVVVTTRVPAGMLGEWLMDVSFLAVSAPGHPLQRARGAITERELARHTQVVVRDSGTERPRDDGWLGAAHRWTVGSLEASLASIEHGLAYGWLPEHLARPRIEAGQLVPLPLKAGRSRKVSLYVVLVRGEAAGPAARRAVELLLAR
jgi:DNA-binding transcriptional LysR family regulator